MSIRRKVRVSSDGTRPAAPPRSATVQQNMNMMRSLANQTAARQAAPPPTATQPSFASSAENAGNGDASAVPAPEPGPLGETPVVASAAEAALLAAGDEVMRAMQEAQNSMQEVEASLLSREADAEASFLQAQREAEQVVAARGQPQLCQPAGGDAGDTHTAADPANAGGFGGGSAGGACACCVPRFTGTRARAGPQLTPEIRPGSSSKGLPARSISEPLAEKMTKTGSRIYTKLWARTAGSVEPSSLL